MQNNENQQSAENGTHGNRENQEIHFHVPPDLDYVYRNVFNVYAGQAEVVIEFGNRHPSMPDHVTISNRIVVSMASAYDLLQTIQRAMQNVQIQMQKDFRKEKNI